MIEAYPVILSKDKTGYFVTIPDFNINTQGDCIADAMVMARDAIGIMGIDMQEEGKMLPESGSISFDTEAGDIVTYVDVDFTEYRRRLENRFVKKNCTIPFWLEKKANQAGINYSQVLQEALIRKVGTKS